MPKYIPDDEDLAGDLINQMSQQIASAVYNTMEVAVPKTRITPLSKPGFMEDIKNQNTTVKHLKDVAGKP